MRAVAGCVLAATAILGVAASSVVAAQPGGIQGPGPEVRAFDFPAFGGSRIDVRVEDLDEGETPSSGVRILEVMPDGPGAEAGLQPQDIVVELDGERVRSAAQFSRIVRETPAGRSVPIAVIRNGERIEATIAPEPSEDRLVLRAPGPPLLPGRELRMRRFGLPEFELPDLGLPRPDRESRAVPGRLGVDALNLDAQLADYFGVEGGVLVSSVRPGSPAEAAGLKAGDVITSAAGQPVRSVRGLRDIVGRDAATELRLEVTRKGSVLELTVKLEARGEGRPV